MKFTVHDDPVGRSAQNYIARADLTPFGLDGQVEQLWFKTVNDGSHVLTCIPFFTYGLSLGDTVLLSDDDYVTEVVATARHRTLRLMFIPDLPPQDLHAARSHINSEISSAGLLSEWNGERFVALDVPPNSDAPKLFGVMERFVDAGQAFWEWSDVRPFAAPS